MNPRLSLPRYLKPGRAAVSLLLALLTVSIANAENLLNNGDFSNFANGAPAGWRNPGDANHELSIDTSNKPAGADRSLKVTINNSGSGLGQISQKFPVEAETEYLVEGWVYSTGSEKGFIQIKLYSDKKELKRIKVSAQDSGWEKLSQRFVAEGANYAEVVLRYKQSANEIGNTLNFADISVVQAPLAK